MNTKMFESLEMNGCFVNGSISSSTPKPTVTPPPNENQYFYQPQMLNKFSYQSPTPPQWYGNYAQYAQTSTPVSYCNVEPYQYQQHPYQQIEPLVAYSNNNNSTSILSSYEINKNHQYYSSTDSAYESSPSVNYSVTSKATKSSFTIDSILSSDKQQHSIEKENVINDDNDSCYDDSQSVKLAANKKTGRSNSKRARTIFTQDQLDKLEVEFMKQQYMVGSERYYLANELNLNEAQVKIWFQNRRIKWRKENVEQRRTTAKPQSPLSPLTNDSLTHE